TLRVKMSMADSRNSVAWLRGSLRHLRSLRRSFPFHWRALCVHTRFAMHHDYSRNSARLRSWAALKWAPGAAENCWLPPGRGRGRRCQEGGAEGTPRSNTQPRRRLVRCSIDRHRDGAGAAAVRPRRVRLHEVQSAVAIDSEERHRAIVLVHAVEELAGGIDFELAGAGIGDPGELPGRYVRPDCGERSRLRVDRKGGDRAVT